MNERAVSRKTVTTTAIGLIALLLTIGCAPSTPDTRPNVILIIADDQSWNNFGFMDHGDIRTPNLDSLAEQSLLFERGYLPMSLCRPSLATLVTGLYPHQHGITGNDVDNVTNAGLKRHRLNDEIYEKVSSLPRLPAILSENGYRTFQSGKWWEGSYENGGFTHGMTHGDPERGGRHGDRGLRIGRKTMKPLFDFIDTSLEKDKPFFVWYSPLMPHLPHDPPDNILNKYLERGLSKKRAQYYAMIEWFDRTVGDITEYLEKRGLRKDTLIVFLSDNGWVPRTKNAYDPEGYTGAWWAARSKASPYEKGIRTPIFFSMPGQIDTARITDDLASSIDIMPTILKIAGIEPPEKLPGIDLTDSEAVASRDAVFGATYAVTDMMPQNPEANRQYRYIIKDKWKLIVREEGKMGKFEGIHQWDDEPVRLYNLDKDPFEKEDLADKRPETVKNLRKELNDWLAPKNAD